MTAPGFATEPGAPGPALYVPPEEGAHARTFMQWPVNRSVYRDRWFLQQVQATIAEVANTLAEFEPVTMLMASEHQARAAASLSEVVEIWDIPTDDLWCRDCGPIFAQKADGTLAVSHIQFNGWGGKQTDVNDRDIARRLAERLGLELVPSGLVGEGGGVDHDGHGLMMAHASSWDTVSRNSGLSPDEIIDRLLNAYGAERMIWADGLRGEDITDYHIDSLARFTGPGRVLMNLPSTPDPRDPFHQTARETHEALLAAGLSVEVIPEPERRRVNSYDFVASYVNYYVCNGAVLTAEFGDPDTDAIAVDALARHYPGREIIALNVDPLGEIGGGIHCATQQMPMV
ncbi:MAG: agmatine deiminase family protein [Pseudomonadota bacterium]